MSRDSPSRSTRWASSGSDRSPPGSTDAAGTCQVRYPASSALGYNLQVRLYDLVHRLVYESNMMLFETTPIVSHDITVGWAKAHSWIPNLKFALTTDNQVEILIDNHAAWQQLSSPTDGTSTVAMSTGSDPSRKGPASWCAFSSRTTRPRSSRSWPQASSRDAVALLKGALPQGGDEDRFDGGEFVHGNAPWGRPKSQCDEIVLRPQGFTLMSIPGI